MKKDMVDIIFCVLYLITKVVIIYLLWTMRVSYLLDIQLDFMTIFYAVLIFDVASSKVGELR